ncbi:MAG: 4Fe-4S dicluster domain-containing protein [Cytophagales bacterium]
MDKYFINIKDSFFSLWAGFGLTFSHLKEARHRHKPTNVQASDYFLENKGIVTLSYPFEAIPLPDNGRYRLHNEIDDCIVCDKCAVVCPVDCIAIETIKTPEPIGETSDGSVKRLWAEKFDIDMAKCCFCGLCTTVCPTECLTMTKVYDFSEVDIRNMNYHFTNLTPDLADDKKKLYDQFVKEKEESKRQQAEAKLATENEIAILQPEKQQFQPAVKVAYKPLIKPMVKKDAGADLSTNNVDNYIDTLKPLENEIVAKGDIIDQQQLENQTQTKEKADELEKPAIKKPVFKPVMKKPDWPSHN